MDPPGKGPATMVGENPVRVDAAEAIARPTGSPKESPQEEEVNTKKSAASDDEYPLDPALFVLSREEKERALAVKRAIEGLSDIDITISDFMCAHLAIAGQGDLEWAVARVYKMQDVQEEYKFLDSYEEGVVAIQAMMEILPHGIMSFSCDPVSGKCAVVMDGVSRLKELWKNPKNVDVTIRGCQYVCRAQFPSLECVRVGNTHVFEMEGYEWGRGMTDVKELSKLTNETQGTYPTVLNFVRFYNTPTMFNCVVSMVKRLIPKELAKTFSFGNTYSGGSLRDFYLVPTPEAAYQRAYINLCRNLKMRFESEKRFSLSN